MNDPVHLQFNCRQILARQRFLDIDIVVEPVINDRTDAKLNILSAIYAFNSLSHQMGCAVSVNVLALFAIQEHNFKPAVLCNRIMKVHEFAVYFTCNRIFLETGTYRFSYCTNFGVIRIPLNVSIRQCYIDLHDCGLHLFKCN
ncbi:hypothetical protein D3C80_1233330 [compost metagenome]